MHQLIKGLFLKKFANPILGKLGDSAVLNFNNRKFAFTTDSFVVSPLEFPGGDIGKLAVCGTINDLVMLGAVPLYLSLAIIIEEGLDYRILKKVVDSLSLQAREAKVCFVTGDIKVVENGACDKIFINTSGLGRILEDRSISLENIKPQDKVIVSGPIARHGLAVLSKRKEFNFDIKSDCAALGGLLIPALKRIEGIRFMRDPTRGGLATTLNEIAEGTNLGIEVEEKKIPLGAKAEAACELLGIDPLYLASEGIAVLIVSPKVAKKTLFLLKAHPLGRNARVIGTVRQGPAGCVALKTVLGTRRIIDMLTSEPLPRIC